IAACLLPCLANGRDLLLDFASCMFRIVQGGFEIGLRLADDTAAHHAAKAAPRRRPAAKSTAGPWPTRDVWSGTPSLAARSIAGTSLGARGHSAGAAGRSARSAKAAKAAAGAGKSSTPKRRSAEAGICAAGLGGEHLSSRDDLLQFRSDDLPLLVPRTKL